MHRPSFRKTHPVAFKSCVSAFPFFSMEHHSNQNCTTSQEANARHGEQAAQFLISRLVIMSDKYVVSDSNSLYMCRYCLTKTGISCLCTAYRTHQTWALRPIGMFLCETAGQIANGWPNTILHARIVTTREETQATMCSSHNLDAAKGMHIIPPGAGFRAKVQGSD